MNNTYIYILANDRGNVLYVGVTQNLKTRIQQHKSRRIRGFTEKYNIHRLLYFEEFPDKKLALQREKQVKGFKRDKKEAIIELKNPSWEDLYDRLPNSSVGNGELERDPSLA